MFRPLALLLLNLALAAPSAAQPSCVRADVSFEAFLKSFKNDGAFREARMRYPLHATFSDPTGTISEQLSLRQIRERKWKVIRDDAFAAEQRGGEGELCESAPQVQGDHATISQSSCRTDVYGDAYSFIRVDGCWFLERVDASGG